MRIRQCMIAFASIIISLLLNIYFVSASDDLFLTGVVRNINSKSKIVSVEVKSGTCRGIRTFKIEDPAELEDLQGKKISFFINSSICKSDEIYEMRKISLLKRGGK